MTFLRYLAYEKPYIYLYLAVFLISAAVFFTDSSGGWVWETFFYAFVLSSMVLIGFLLFRYQQNVRIIRQMKGEDVDILSLEGEFARQHIEELKNQHIRELNRIQEMQMSIMILSSLGFMK